MRFKILFLTHFSGKKSKESGSGRYTKICAHSMVW